MRMFRANDTRDTRDGQAERPLLDTEEFPEPVKPSKAEPVGQVLV